MQNVSFIGFTQSLHKSVFPVSTPNKFYRNVHLSSNLFRKRYLSSTSSIRSNLLTYIKELKPRRQISVQTKIKSNVRPTVILAAGSTGISLAVALNLIRNGVVVRCHSDRTTGFRKVARPDDGRFDWAMFWRYLRPHLMKLLGAIAVRVNLPWAISR